MKRIAVSLAVLVLLAAFAAQAVARSQAKTSVTASAKSQRLGETTWIVTVSGSSKLAFIISACIVLVGAAFWGFVVGPVKETRWRNT